MDQPTIPIALFGAAGAFRASDTLILPINEGSNET